MIVNYSINGGVTVNGVNVASKFIVKNLTNDFTSKEYISEIGYYNTNLGNFKDTIFNNGDLITITFFIRHNGIDYSYIAYTFIDITKDVTTMNIQLQPNWNYTSNILLTKSNTNVNIKFVTNIYQSIVYILYIKYDGVYKEVSKKNILSQNVNIKVSSNGEYKVVGYVLDNNRLLSYTSKEFDIENVVIEDCQQTTYYDWE